MEILYIGLLSKKEMLRPAVGAEIDPLAGSYYLDGISGSARLGYTRSNPARMGFIALYAFDEYNIEYKTHRYEGREAQGGGIRASKSIWGAICAGHGCVPSQNYGINDRYYRIEAEVIPIGDKDLPYSGFEGDYANGCVRVKSLIFKEQVFLEDFINLPRSATEELMIGAHIPNFPVMPWSDPNWTNLP